MEIWYFIMFTPVIFISILSMWFIAFIMGLLLYRLMKDWWNGE